MMLSCFLIQASTSVVGLPHLRCCSKMLKRSIHVAIQGKITRFLHKWTVKYGIMNVASDHFFSFLLYAIQYVPHMLQMDRCQGV